MPKTTPLVFVSSTKEDLEEYRVALLKSFPSLDVLYRGMEFFGSRSQKPIKTMLAELRQCDVYLGIIGHRYGSIDAETKLSYTELEYQKAVEFGIEVKCFIIEGAQPIAADRYEQNQESADKLKKLKQLIRERHVTESFSTPEDLTAKVAHSLAQWIAENEQSWKRLRYRPINHFEDRYVRQLHSSRIEDVREAISRLDGSNSQAVCEHLYALLHRRNLAEDDSKSVLRVLIHSPDELRLSQMLRNLAEDLAVRRDQVIFAIGQRATLEDRQISADEVGCVIRYAEDPNADVRKAVGHALYKIIAVADERPSLSYIPVPELVSLLRKLAEDPDESVRQRATEALRQVARAARAAG